MGLGKILFFYSYYHSQVGQSTKASSKAFSHFPRLDSGAQAVSYFLYHVGFGRKPKPVLPAAWCFFSPLCADLPLVLCWKFLYHFILDSEEIIRATSCCFALRLPHLKFACARDKKLSTESCSFVPDAGGGGPCDQLSFRRTHPWGLGGCAHSPPQPACWGTPLTPMAIQRWFWRKHCGFFGGVVWRLEKKQKWKHPYQIYNTKYHFVSKKGNYRISFPACWGTIWVVVCFFGGGDE